MTIFGCFADCFPSWCSFRTFNQLQLLQVGSGRHWRSNRTGEAACVGQLRVIWKERRNAFTLCQEESAESSFISDFLELPGNMLN